MNTNFLKNLFFSCLFIVIGCKENRLKSEVIPLKKENIKEKIISLKNFKQFNEIKNGSEFTLQDYSIKYNASSNMFQLLKNNTIIKSINLNTESEGYNIYLYQSLETSKKAIVIEGTADIGTAWYYFILLDNESVENEFYVYEPRSNSENTPLNDFLSIEINNIEWILKFNIKQIAKYSTIPKDLKVDNQFAYKKIPFSKKEENNNSNISVLKGMYFIDAEVTSIKTTNEAKMRFNLYFENDDNMNLRISTIDAEDAYCEGHYKLIQEDNNIIKAVYDDEGICTEDGENIFFIKKEASKTYIKSQRFINTEWQELYKE